MKKSNSPAMRKSILLFTLAFFISAISFAQKSEGNVLKKGTDEYKIFMAKQDFFGGDYRSALNKFKEIQKNRPNDASVHFWIGNCYFMMKTYQDALDELEKAKSIDANASSDLNLVLGKAYHMRGMIDKALESFNTYRKTIESSPKKISESDVDVFISQCNIAKEMMAHSVNAKLHFMVDINSQYDDKGPVLANGEKTIIFTSRRPMDDKSKTDKEGDFGFFDNVYESYWSDEKKNWLAADLIRGPINLDGGYNSVSSISSDGTQMFIYRNHNTEAHGGEIFVSKKATSGKWKNPEILLKPINTSYYEDAAVLSPDGNTLYFVSERPGGLGNGDIWMSKKSGSEWAEPVNLGAPVNTPFDENGLWLAPDGKTLFFCSNGPNSMGLHDIFKTTVDEKGKWSKPVNIGYPINSVNMESKFVMTADKKTAYISSVRDSGLGERDIIMLDISNYDVMTGVSAPSAPLTATLSGKITTADSTHKALPAEIRILDKNTGMQSAMTKSGEDGSYTIEFPGGKPFMIEVSSEGYQKLSEDISLPAGKTETKDISLKKNN